MAKMNEHLRIVKDDNVYDPPALAGDGGGTHDGGMEHRVTALETRLDSILPTLATREDMHKIDASIKGWMIATIVSLFLGFAGLFFTVSNSLKPGAQPAAQQVPIVIQVPPYQAATFQQPPAPAASTPKKPAH